MKKHCIQIICFVLCIFSLVACGKQNVNSHVEAFVGSWSCAESPIEHEDYYTGFIMLYIEEDGSFRMTDVEAGNPVISGKIEVVSDTELVLKCDTEDDFDPPPTWTSMEEEQVVVYSFAEDGALHLSYESEEGTSTLVFLQE